LKLLRVASGGRRPDSHSVELGGFTGAILRKIETHDFANDARVFPVVFIDAVSTPTPASISNPVA
tara:strand:+ start:1669 stop:1863 length:195 start_codon:yes stop_codon:yes gene_type:complete